VKNPLSTNHRQSQDDQSEATAQMEKEPYKAPSFRFEEIFEVRALACGEINPRVMACNLTYKNS
jgi:hypothetical protein